MNIFWREFKASFKSLIIWSVIVIVFNVVGFSKFTAYYGNPEMLAILDSMPPAVMDALSMRAFNLTTLTGFFGVMFVYFALMLSIAAAMWGSDAISKEERDKTVEFALTLPVTRGRVVFSKTAAALLDCILLLLVTWGITLVSSSKYAPESGFTSFVSISMLAFFILQLVFLAIGVLLGCTLKQYRRASSIAVAVILVTYFFSVISGLSDKVEFLKYFSPFKYFDPAMLLNESRFDLTFVLLSAGIVVASLVGGYFAYSKRDLYI